MQELVSAAFKRGSVHPPEGEEEEPTPVKVRFMLTIPTLKTVNGVQNVAGTMCVRPPDVAS